MKLRFTILVFVGAFCGSGCAVLPEKAHQPQFHNPFPQLHRVAILPFFNLSSEPTVDQDQMAEAYYHELQKIPGFEVMPPGVVRRALEANRIVPDGSTDFQKLARWLGVDAVVRGAVTEFSPYYPPRMGLAVDWFAANPSFHPIPPGYGLPWGTPAEEYIPRSLLFEAEFALAREQLKTQSPDVPPGLDARPTARQLSAEESVQGGAAPEGVTPAELATSGAAGLPTDWPDPRGFIPAPPSPVRPGYRPQREPVMTHTRVYDGSSLHVTERLEDYCYFRDDARGGNWQGYLMRSHDFTRFCCHLHITEMLTARGGAGETRVVWRWPIGRYDVGTGHR